MNVVRFRLRASTSDTKRRRPSLRTKKLTNALSSVSSLANLSHVASNRLISRQVAMPVVMILSGIVLRDRVR